MLYIPISKPVKHYCIIYHINKCKQIGLILFPTIFHPENMFVSYFIICDIANCDTFTYSRLCKNKRYIALFYTFSQAQ